MSQRGTIASKFTSFRGYSFPPHSKSREGQIAVLAPPFTVIALLYNFQKSIHNRAGLFIIKGNYDILFLKHIQL